MMATYDPPQPIWKRNLAGILDFVLAFFVCVYLSAKLFGNFSDAPVFGEPVVYFGFGDANFKVGGVSALLAAVLMIAYFVILGQTGGTVFQRLFGMKRVDAIPHSRRSP
jgi:RDD family